jgi:hypothetical protein
MRPEVSHELVVIDHDSDWTSPTVIAQKSHFELQRIRSALA